MAVKLKTIKAQTRILEPIMFGDDSLNVKFFVNVYTPQFEEESQRRRNSGVETTAGEALGMMVVPLLESWDLSDDYEVGLIKEFVEPLVHNIDEDNNTSYIAPPINEWKFYYYDSRLKKLIEAQHETIKEIDTSNNECTIKRFIPEIDKHGEVITIEQIVPISTTGLSNVPMIVMTELLRRIGEALTPGEAKKTNSGESSFTDE